MTALGLAWLLAALAVAGPSGDPPSFILIVADDLGAEDLGYTGHPVHRTPSIDRLASEGAVFDAAYSCAANCAPSRASLMSGRYSPRTGVYTVGSSKRGSSRARRLIPIENRRHLEADIPTLAEGLSSAGYSTAAIGKWHLGEGPTGPAARGFELALAGNLAGHPKSYASPYANPELSDGPEGEHLTARLTDEALRFVRTAQPPYFLYLSYFAVHTPIQPPPERVERVRARLGEDGLELSDRNLRYAAFVEELDAQVGRLLEGIEDLEHEPIVAFTSDNGPHSRIGSRELRGSKGTFYEGGIRVPQIVRWSGRIEPRNIATPVIGVDWLPTLCEWAGTETPPPVDGHSLVGLLTRAEPLPERTLFWHFPAYLEATKNSASPWRTAPVGALRHGPYKLLEFFEDESVELYDLDQDPSESNDLASTRPELRDELLAELAAWRDATDAPVPSELNPEFEAD